MEACIDTFSAVFGSAAGDYKSSSRNTSPFDHNFENTYQSYPSHHQQFSVVNQSLCANDTLNGHYINLQQPIHIQRQTNGSNSGNANNGSQDMFSPNTNGFEQAMSWTDRPIMSSANSSAGSSNTIIGSTNNNHGGNVGRDSKMLQLATTTSSSNGAMSTITTVVDNHSFHPFVGNDGISAAFNLQQLHQGICSVGTLPSWQQDFTFSDCPSTSAPSQNDEGNDTRTLPMPLSMSSVPTTSSSHPTVLATEHQRSSVTNVNVSDNHQFANRLGTIPPCQAGNNNGRITNERQAEQQHLDSHRNGQFSAGNNYANGSVTLTFSASVLNDGQGSNGMGNAPSSPRRSPLPNYAPSVASSGANESTAD